MADPKPTPRKVKKRRFNFDAILLLLMLTVGCISALGGFLFGRSAMKEVTPSPNDRRVLKPSQIQKPRKVNLLPRYPLQATYRTAWKQSWIS